MSREYIAFTGLKGQSTLSSQAISVRGKVKCLGSEPLQRLFDRNPYMYEIYPNESARESLVVFQLYEGQGEWFDLSKKPIERDSFTIGNTELHQNVYFINDSCISCGACLEVCPQECIDIYSMPAIIHQENCLHCGKCVDVCPMMAIQKLEI